MKTLRRVIKDGTPPASTLFSNFHLGLLHFSLFFLSLKCPKNDVLWLNTPSGTCWESWGQKGGEVAAKSASQSPKPPYFFSISGRVRSTGPYSSGRPEDQISSFGKRSSRQALCPPLHLICFYPFYPNFKN